MAGIAGLNLVDGAMSLCLDALNPRSYPGTGATWFDISGQGRNMALFNSPTYANGVLQFNGVNQYGDISSMNYASTSFTIMAASRYSGASRGRVVTSISNNWLLGHWGSSTERYFAEGWISETGPSDTNWRIYTGVENFAGDSRSFYVNDSLLVSNSNLGSAGFNGLKVGSWGAGTGSEASTCEVSFIVVYDRILSQQEVAQNVNTIRGRYGI